MTFHESGIRNIEGLSRRGFLSASMIGTLALARRTVRPSNEPAVVLLMMVGGPSQLETFDPKPDAPSTVRGPFDSIATAVPGVWISEFLPRIARRMDRLTLIRSLHHESACLHEIGLQLLQTGKVCRMGEEHPHFGSVAARIFGDKTDCPTFAMLPGPIAPMGMSISRGMTAGALGSDYEAEGWGSRLSTHRLTEEPGKVREAYGASAFGRNCLRARKLVLAGSRVVQVNMGQNLFKDLTWDCHGRSPFTSLDDYKRFLLPEFDAGFSALIDDLDRNGLLDTTLVVATGEFGRSPFVNQAGGRDHWPNVWSALMAGGGTQGGEVIGSTDSHAAEAIDQPMSPSELLARIYRHLGIDPTRPIACSGGTIISLANA